MYLLRLQNNVFSLSCFIAALHLSNTFMHTYILSQYESYYDHTYSPDRDSLTWNLDYDKTSDFDDVSGHWHVEDHPSTPGRSRVFYACDIKMKGSVPKPILSYISKSALKQATGWVKKESEQNPEATVPSQYAGASSKMMSFGKK
jgi:hypothetical protein